jgi:serine/threonine protein kinase
LAEIVEGIGQLHHYRVIYRGLKPDNILLTGEGHLKIADFGLSTILAPLCPYSSTVCGTITYMAPEMLQEKCKYTMSVDYWALGMIATEMVAGFHPVTHDNDLRVVLRNIKRLKPPFNITGVCGEIIAALLNPEPTERLGCNGVAYGKGYPFFHNIQWTKIYNFSYKPPYQRSTNSDFEEQFGFLPIDQKYICHNVDKCKQKISKVSLFF